jgi:hypothetical protein
MWQNTPSFTWNSYGSMRLRLAMQGVSKGALQWYSKCYSVVSHKMPIVQGAELEERKEVIAVFN